MTTVDGHVHTNPYGDGPLPPNTEQYKPDYLTYLLEDVGLDIVRVYGNATTDISAYEAVGLPKSETYIIGEHAGVRCLGHLGLFRNSKTI